MSSIPSTAKKKKKKQQQQLKHTLEIIWKIPIIRDYLNLIKTSLGLLSSK
jgi:hypothetical protein